MKKIRQQSQRLLCQKEKTFSGNFIAFLKSPQDFALFEKKHQLHTLNISEVSYSEKCGYFDARKLLF